MPSKSDVVTAAATLADRDGFENLTLAIVAKKLGIRTPSLYNHVDGLPGLRRDLLLMGIDMLRSEIVRAAIGRERDKAVLEVARAYRQFALTHPGLYAATFQPVRSPEESAAAGELLAVVVSALQGYGLGTEETLHAVRGLRSALHGFVTLESTGQFAMPLDIATSFDILIETIIAGLQSSKLSVK